MIFLGVCIFAASLIIYVGLTHLADVIKKKPLNVSIDGGPQYSILSKPISVKLITAESLATLS